MKRGNKQIIVISDGTGRTAKQILRAMLVQFPGFQEQYEAVVTYSQIQTEAQVNATMRHIHREDLAIFTIIDPKLRSFLHGKLERCGTYHLNVLGPMLRIMSEFLGIRPQFKPGLLQRVDDEYFRRIEAIPFAIDHDDGRGERLQQAEIILIGPSRCSKTPLSVYLATTESRYVANIPLINTPEEFARVRAALVPHAKKVVGLYLEPGELAKLREARMKHLVAKGVVPAGLEDYFNVETVQREVTACRRFYERMSWPSVNATHRGIEEIGREVLELLHVPRMYEESWT